jgi:hypothetical protein
MAQLYPGALGSLLWPLTTSRAYGGGILTCLKLQLELEIQVQVILRPMVSQLYPLLVRPPFVSHSQICIIVGHLWSLCCREPSPRRRRVCNLLVQFVLTLGPKARRTHDHILLSHLRLPQPGGPGCEYFTQVRVILRPTISRSVRLRVGPPLGPMNRF